MKNRVEELRKRSGMNQEDFAKAIKVSRQTVSSIETGKYNPSLELAFIISDFSANQLRTFLFTKGTVKMKKSNLAEGILFISGGVILLCAALLTDTVLDSLLIGLAAGSICSGFVMTCKYFYWNAPKNKERYQEKLAAETIELHDELKAKLRDKSGRYAYTAGLIAVSLSIIIFCTWPAWDCS